MIDGRIVVMGFGVSFWYSHYTGEVPCSCDIALEELRAENDADDDDDEDCEPKWPQPIVDHDPRTMKLPGMSD